MPSVFTYDENFREYVKLVMKERKLSYRKLASDADIDVRVLHDVINKSKHLPLAGALKLSNALKHGKTEKEYFIQLVQLTQSKNREEIDFIQDQMAKIKSETDDSHPVVVDIYEYFSTVRHSVVRSLVVMSSFGDDYQLLGSSLAPPITTEEAKQSVQLLERLGLIFKDKNGNYQPKDINIHANIPDEAKRRFHRECSEMIKKQIFYYFPHDCTVYNATLGMSRKTYEIVREELRKLFDKTFKLVKNEKLADRVYQCQLAIVPMSDTLRSN